MNILQRYSIITVLYSTSNNNNDNNSNNNNDNNIKYNNNCKYIYHNRIVIIKITIIIMLVRRLADYSGSRAACGRASAAPSGPPGTRPVEVTNKCSLCISLSLSLYLYLSLSLSIYIYIYINTHIHILICNFCICSQGSRRTTSEAPPEPFI